MPRSIASEISLVASEIRSGSDVGRRLTEAGSGDLSTAFKTGLITALEFAEVLPSRLVDEAIRSLSARDRKLAA